MKYLIICLMVLIGCTPTFEKIKVGRCYQMYNENPFKSEAFIIKIEEIKDGYALFEYTDIKTKNSNDIDSIYRNFYEIPCPQEKK